MTYESTECVLRAQGYRPTVWSFIASTPLLLVGLQQVTLYNGLFSDQNFSLDLF